MINIVVLSPCTAGFPFVPLAALCRKHTTETRMVLPLSFESFSLQTTRSNSHELIQYHKLKLDVQGVANSLYRMADANTVKVE